MPPGAATKPPAVRAARSPPGGQPYGRPRPDPVMLLQGIVRSRFSLGRMGRGLAAAGFEVYSLGGPSPRLPLEVQAVRFQRSLERLGQELREVTGGAPPVMHGVGHSMGGIVLRVALAQADNIGPGRVVAVATPFLGTRGRRGLPAPRRPPRPRRGAICRGTAPPSADSPPGRARSPRAA